MSDGLNRRDFLKVVGVTGVAASAAACGVEQNVKLVPYVVPPEEIIPGVPVIYASTCRECPAGCGTHVKTREGRPIKIEGNPLHPVNRGTLCARGQASLQGLYNPDRVTGPMTRSGGGWQKVAWDGALKMVSDKVAALKSAGNGQSVWLVTPELTGSLDALCGEWLSAAGSTSRVVYEPFGLEAVREGSRIAFGRDEIPQYALSRARFILSFGAEFLDAWNSPLEQSREFAGAHGYDNGRMARFVAVDPRLSLAATNADEWIAPVPGTEMHLALAMAQSIVASGKARGAVSLDLSAWAPEKVAESTGVPAETIHRLAGEFAAARPSVALPGGVALQHANAAAFAVAVNVLNHVAGNVGETVVFSVRPAASSPVARGAKGMADLIAAMNGGKVQALVILDANPAYSLPKAFGFSEALAKVPFKVAITQFLDETAEACDLVLADNAPLESWGDWTPRAGVASLQQPVIQPLYDTRQAMDILLQTAKALGAQPGATAAGGPATAMEYVQARWRKVHEQAGTAETFDAWWRNALAKGGVFADLSGAGAFLGDLSAVKFDPPALEGDGLVLVAYPGVTYDGRGANRPWLLELPDPITKTVWSTPVEIHPETAEKNGIEMADVVEITTPAGTIEAVAHLTPGIRRDAVAVPFGWGHRALGRWAKGLGSSAFEVLPARFDPASGAPAYLSVRAKVSSKGPAPFDLRTQISEDQEGRGIAQSVTLASLMGHGEAQAEHGHEEPPEGTVIPVEQWPQVDASSPDYRWGMAIDLSRCSGCSACTAACYAENNIPMIGASEGVVNGLKNFEQGRIMTWIRLERYLEQDAKGNVVAEQLPMLCQHCGAAPCEPVCPVFAAYHDHEGLNGQVYNRCVGTRYCGNNCPYKVRRFNWFNYVWVEPLHLQLNPDVTVRCKGVMEKCTFCIQRIQTARDHAKDEGRKIRDGEITPACAQACPTKAITFGNLKDPNSRVSVLHRDPRTYRVLQQLNTRPAVAYLKRVRAEHGEA